MNINQTYNEKCFGMLHFLSSIPDLPGWRASSPCIVKMEVLPPIVLGSYRHLQGNKYALTFLVLALCHYGVATEWPVTYHMADSYIKFPGEWKIYHQYHYDYSFPQLVRDVAVFPVLSWACLPVGTYKEGTDSYAVCNTAPTQNYIKDLVENVISNNITSAHVSYSGRPREKKSLSAYKFQCVRFFIRNLRQNTTVRVSNLTATLCPELSFASILYLHTHLDFVRIDGLPMQQDHSNSTPMCTVSSRLEVIILYDNGLVYPPFSSCPTYFDKLKQASLEKQDLRLEVGQLFPVSNKLKYLSLVACSLQEIYTSNFHGLNFLLMLNISHNNISFIPTDAFYDLTRLRELRAEHNRLSVLNMLSFQRLESLQYLYLSANGLHTLNGEVAILPTLRVINLDSNYLARISRDTFRNSPMLTFITLAHNAIREIEPGAFYNMTNLRVIDMWRNLLTHLNACDWFDAVTKIVNLILPFNLISNMEGQKCLPQMEVLNLFDNNFSAIPSLRNLDNLKILELSRNPIQNISSKEIASAPRLSYLQLDTIYLSKLDAQIKSRSIEKFNLRFNQYLRIIPALCFAGLHSLQKLNLSYNNIAYLGAFAFPANLQILDLYGNRLLFVDTHQPLSNLRILKMGNNDLKHLFNTSLPNVVHLDISENPFGSLALKLCQKMPLLEIINLEDTGITYDRSLEFNLFGKCCTYWRQISLAKNQISKIDDFTMLHTVRGGIDYSQNPLKSIPYFQSKDGDTHYLYFNNCSIESIASMAFENMLGLTRVELKENNIQYFPELSPSGVDFDLRNNPIVCSCHLRWLHGHPRRARYLFTTCFDVMTGSSEVFDNLPPERLVCEHDINCVQECACFGTNTSTVSIVNCSSQSLLTIPFGLPPEADIIYLDHNHFSKPYFLCDGQMNARKMFLQNSDVTSLESNLFAKFTALQMIDLSYNELYVINISTFLGLRDLRWLFLHGNHIHRIDGGAAGHRIYRVQMVTLHENEFENISEPFDRIVNNTFLKNITLAGNPWQCASCAGPILREWLVQHAGIVSDAADIHCNRSHLPVLDIRTDTLEYARCVNDTRTIENSHWGLAAGLTASPVLILISLVLIYCYRNHIQVLLYNNFDFLKKRRRELKVLYDVRIIYDEKDERVRQWVVGDLLQVLEAQWGHNVFLVERDMLAGGNHADEIAQSIRQSRRTLIILSDNFVGNEWAQFAHQAAFQFQIENKLHRVLVVAWETLDIGPLDYSIKLHFKTKQVMFRNSHRFWPVLKSKLPLGRQNGCQNPDGIQLNVLHN